jgi:hypothetical protein
MAYPNLLLCSNRAVAGLHCGDNHSMAAPNLLMSNHHAVAARHRGNDHDTAWYDHRDDLTRCGAHSFAVSSYILYEADGIDRQSVVGKHLQNPPMCAQRCPRTLTNLSANI